MCIDGTHVFGQSVEVVTGMIVGPEDKEVILGFASADGSIRQVIIPRAAPANPGSVLLPPCCVLTNPLLLGCRHAKL